MAALLPHRLEAGAWVQKKGALQSVQTVSYYASDERYDLSGNRVAQPDYSKLEWNPYLEYGLTDATTIGASLFLQSVENGGDNNAGLSDSEWFVRHRIWESGGFVVSLQPSFTLPGEIAAEDSPVIGNDHATVALRALGGASFEALGRWHYADIGAGYRHRFGEPGDQLHLDVTVGLAITDSLTLMPQLFATRRADEGETSAFTQTSRDDYDLLRTQVSVLYRLNAQHSLQAGVFTHAAGKNIGAGDGALLSLWSNF